MPEGDEIDIADADGPMEVDLVVEVSFVFDSPSELPLFLCFSSCSCSLILRPVYVS